MATFHTTAAIQPSHNSKAQCTSAVITAGTKTTTTQVKRACESCPVSSWRTAQDKTLRTCVCKKFASLSGRACSINKAKRMAKKLMSSHHTDALRLA
jgi:hypothetical protein